MFFLIRIIPWLTFIILTILFSVKFWYIPATWYTLPLSGIIVYIATMFLVYSTKSTAKTSLQHLINTAPTAALPAIFIMSAHTFVLFLNDATIYTILSFISILTLSIYLETIFLFFYSTTKYQQYAKESLTESITLLTMFFIGASLSGLSIFVNVSAWIIIMLFIFITFILTLNFCKTLKFPTDTLRQTIAIITFCMTEIFILLLLFPIQLYAIGGVSAICFYFFLKLAQIKNKENDSAKKFVYLGIFIMVGITIILATAQWQ